MPELPETLEDRLARTMRAAAGLVPDENQVEDLVPGLARRRSRRARQRVHTLLAAAAVLLALAATSFAAVRLAARPTVADQPIQIEDAGPISNVWPLAVVPTPERSSDGLTYEPWAALDASHILLAAAPAGKDAFPVRFDVYDTSSKTIAPLTDLPRTTGLERQTLMYAEGDEAHVIWEVLAIGTGPSKVSELWTIPRSGGSATLLHSFRANDKDQAHFFYHLNGDTVEWMGGDPVRSPMDSLYRLPVTGGTPERVPSPAGSLNFGIPLTPWPWVQIAPGYFVADTSPSDGPAPSVTAGVSDSGGETPGERPEQVDAPTSLVNVLTGQTIPVRPAKDVASLYCDLHWCGGITKSGRPLIQHPDGSGYQVLPDTGYRSWVILDRFVALAHHPKDGSALRPYQLLDLRTGRMVSFEAESIEPISYTHLSKWRGEAPDHRWWVLNYKATE
ncbi:hypothetical protein J5X84_03805 [Streptosporangiaceae bacterium NEAU-GS5]|nr:hypothetical protein [Streptosporangiaceae bacterium NEAU-GS5]